MVSNHCNAHVGLNMCTYFILALYGTHQLQLRRDTCLLTTKYTCYFATSVYVTLCVVSSKPQTREKTHELRVHVYTLHFTRTRVHWLYTHTILLCTELQYSLTKYLHCYKSTILQRFY